MCSSCNSCGNVLGTMTFPDFVQQRCCNPCCKQTTGSVGGTSTSKPSCTCTCTCTPSGGTVGGTSTGNGSNNSSNCGSSCGCGCGCCRRCGCGSCGACGSVGGASNSGSCSGCGCRRCSGYKPIVPGGKPPGNCFFGAGLVYFLVSRKGAFAHERLFLPPVCTVEGRGPV